MTRPWLGALRDRRDVGSATATRSLPRRLRDLVLAPPPGTEPGPPGPPGPPDPVVRRPTPVALALLCAPADAPAVAVSAAALLARRGDGRGACAVACVWTPDDADPATGRSASATGPARRLAAALAARELPVAARGRGAIVALPAAPADALAVARRALAAAGRAPTVVVLGGARDAAFDALLAEQDLVVVLTRTAQDDATAALAVAGLDAAGAPAVARSLALGPAARALGRSGMSVPAAVRQALRGPLEELS